MKEYIIKKLPPHKIILHKEGFEIFNQQYGDESGFFLYSKLYDISFREKSKDYTGSILIYF